MKILTKDSAIICYYNAYGDNIHMSAVLDGLAKKYRHVYMDTNIYGLELFKHDPRIKQIYYFEPHTHFDGYTLGPGIRKHIQTIRDDNPDATIIDFFGLVDFQFYDTEVGDPLLTWNERKQRYGKNWYEVFFEQANLELPKNFHVKPSLYFKPGLEKEVKDLWAKPNRKYFKVIVPLGGTTRNKGFPTWIEDFCKQLIDSYPRMRLFTVGDSHCAGMEWNYERTINLSHKKERALLPFVNTILMAKYADFVFGPETGILSAAGMWGTPKCTLCTASSVEQLTKYQKNDYSQQSTVTCSPCYRTCYEGPTRVKEPCPALNKEFSYLPKCIGEFDLERLNQTIEGLYRTWQKKYFV